MEKRVRGKPSPWISGELKRCIRERDYQLRKARRTNKNEDWATYESLRNSVTRSIKRAKSNYNRKLIEENMQDPKAFWKTIKKIMPGESKEVSSSFKINGEICTGNKQIAASFDSFFTETVSRLVQLIGVEASLLFRSPKKTVTTDKTSQTFKFVEISEEFVHKKLKSLKTNKASGLDQLSPRLMKDSSSLIAKPLALIMNYSIAQGSIPLDWKASKVSPLYKGGKAYDMDNHRPIAVLCISSKIFERAIHSQLSGFLEKNKLLSPYQCGFRKRYSTELATISLSDSILRSMDQGMLTGSVFIDLKKAFDTVDHDLLIEKLSRYGVRSSELLWFRNYLHDRSQVVQSSKLH